MAKNSKIEWTHHTFNPWVGCTRISPACDHCYAEGWAKRTGQSHLWAGERRRTSVSNWQQPVKWDRAAAAAGERHRVFCASLADVFDNQVPARWRDDLWHRISQTPNLDWMLLTKRPQNIAKMLPTPEIGAAAWGAGWPNVWLGTTIEDRERLRNLDHLRTVPAAIRFLSIEPLLEGLGAIDLTGIHLVIVGGESGPGARPMYPAWVRSIREQCAIQGVAFFFKQWGEWAPGVLRTDWSVVANDGQLLVDDPRLDLQQISRVGKKAAGRLLDGVEHNGFPEARA
ncbi:phage Gp37/Gp68 family protein [Methylobacterium sp. J-076]|uniref:phage Gp37/Gp68 family protein n=1 Tax=Methylobacterium sp. J-076 TaxID=2836655 RepID=UPI001FB91559|nr:phage Gp37/Gp68 family protein [Methylobacterium sp. J-076]MCJ2015230.1 phage Gp37/Gp68 family protein [Methylobacterium sp. J-076]